MVTSPDADDEADGPAFEPEDLAEFEDFAPPPMALDVTACTNGAATCAMKPEAFEGMIRYCPCEMFDV